jgi:hypothetical protein
MLAMGKLPEVDLFTKIVWVGIVVFGTTFIVVGGYSVKVMLFGW